MDKLIDTNDISFKAFVIICNVVDVNGEERLSINLY